MPVFFIPVLYSIFGFLLGGVLFSYHLPKLLRKVDIVALSPDHNPGTANVVKLCGLPLGLLCLALDMAKGFLPVWLAMRRLPPDTLWLAPVLLAPVLGHALAVFYPFRGGKAVAVTFGVLLGLLPFSYAVFALALPYIFFSTIVVLHPNERRSVVSFFLLGAFCVLASLRTHHFGVALGASGIAVVGMWKNRVRDPLFRRRPDLEESRS